MRYARARRLTEAAKSLAGGAADILAVALDAGYGSHEAFTRAFRDQFGMTPETVRAQRHLDNLQIQEPIRIETVHTATIKPPRFENGRLMLIAGIGVHYSCEASLGIPAQWQRFTPYIGTISSQRGRTAYGLRVNSDDAGNFHYVAGVEVTSFDDMPDELVRIRVPEQRYAVFTHTGHISAIRETHHVIWSKWLPESGLKTADAPDFERYGEDFDPQTGTGTVEIWIPVER